MSFARGTRSIGEVLAILKRDFADVSISKIRFLESQGLISPERTSSGYRKFTDTDIARLRFVLRQQQEHFLPLRVIKDKLDRGELVDDERPQHRPDVVYSRAEILDACTQLTESKLRELEQFGLIQGRRTGNGVVYSYDALQIARLASEFLQFGMEPRHLRPFRNAADREAELYKQVVIALHAKKGTTARVEAESQLAELQRLGLALHAELLAQSLRNA